MSATDPRDPKFTARLERALTHLARGTKKVAAVAAACGVPSLDVYLWLNTFNEGRTALTATRIEEVKREVGVLVKRRLTAAELAEYAAKRKGREAEEQAKAEERERERLEAVARREREVEARREAKAKGVRDRAEAKIATKRARAVQAAEGKVVGVLLPWRQKSPGWVVRTVRNWRPWMELVAQGVVGDELLARMRQSGGRRLICAWCTVRLYYFGAPENCTAQAAAELLAYVDAVAAGGGVQTVPRVRVTEPRPEGSEQVRAAMAEVHAALAKLEAALAAERRAA